jgi:hypothetical protein
VSQALEKRHSAARSGGRCGCSGGRGWRPHRPSSSRALPGAAEPRPGPLAATGGVRPFGGYGFRMAAVATPTTGEGDCSARAASTRSGIGGRLGLRARTAQ